MNSNVSQVDGKSIDGKQKVMCVCDFLVGLDPLGSEHLGLSLVLACCSALLKGQVLRSPRVPCSNALSQVRYGHFCDSVRASDGLPREDSSARIPLPSIFHESLLVLQPSHDNGM